MEPGLFPTTVSNSLRENEAVFRYMMREVKPSLSLLPTSTTVPVGSQAIVVSSVNRGLEKVLTTVWLTVSMADMELVPEFRI